MKNVMQLALSMAVAWTFSGIAPSAWAADTTTAPDKNKSAAQGKGGVTRNYSGANESGKSQTQAAASGKNASKPAVKASPNKKKHKKSTTKHTAKKKSRGKKSKTKPAPKTSTAPAATADKDKK